MTELKRIMTEFKVCRRKARGYVRLREVSEKLCKGRGLKKLRKILEKEQCQKVHFVKYGDFETKEERLLLTNFLGFGIIQTESIPRIGNAVKRKETQCL